MDTKIGDNVSNGSFMVNDGEYVECSKDEAGITLTGGADGKTTYARRVNPEPELCGCCGGKPTRSDTVSGWLRCDPCGKGWWDEPPHHALIKSACPTHGEEAVRRRMRECGDVGHSRSKANPAQRLGEYCWACERDKLTLGGDGHEFNAKRTPCLNCQATGEPKTREGVCVECLLPDLKLGVNGDLTMDTDAMVQHIGKKIRSALGVECPSDGLGNACGVRSKQFNVGCVMPGGHKGDHIANGFAWAPERCKAKSSCGTYTCASGTAHSGRHRNAFGYSWPNDNPERCGATKTSQRGREYSCGYDPGHAGRHFGYCAEGTHMPWDGGPDRSAADTGRSEEPAALSADPCCCRSYHERTGLHAVVCPLHAIENRHNCRYCKANLADTDVVGGLYGDALCATCAVKESQAVCPKDGASGDRLPDGTHFHSADTESNRLYHRWSADGEFAEGRVLEGASITEGAPLPSEMPCNGCKGPLTERPVNGEMRKDWCETCKGCSEWLSPPEAKVDKLAAWAERQKRIDKDMGRGVGLYADYRTTPHGGWVERPNQGVQHTRCVHGHLTGCYACNGQDVRTESE